LKVWAPVGWPCGQPTSSAQANEEDVDRGQLPNRALRPLQAADEETVDTDQLARPLSLDVPLRRRLAGRLVRRRVAGKECEPPGAGVETMPAQAAPDAVVADDDPAPALLTQLARDPVRSIAGVAEREGDDALFDKRRQLLRHPRRSLGRRISSPCRSARRLQT
jgi:hypothetical protein